MMDFEGFVGDVVGGDFVFCDYEVGWGDGEYLVYEVDYVVGDVVGDCEVFVFVGVCDEFVGGVYDYGVCGECVGDCVCLCVEVFFVFGVDEGVYVEFDCVGVWVGCCEGFELCCGEWYMIVDYDEFVVVVCEGDVFCVYWCGDFLVDVGVYVGWFDVE